jgi:lysozyme family protein
MDDNYEEGFETLMSLEGFKSNVAGDSGGLTIWGITEKWFPSVVAELKNLPPEESRIRARRFYYDKFWKPNNCDKRNFPDDIITFCIAVNNGMRQFDADTWEGDLLGSVERYLDIVDRNPSQMKFLKGWLRRVVRLWRSYRGK